MTPSNTDLREAIEKIFFKYRSTKHIRENNSNYWPLFTDLIDLFQAREQELLTELLGQAEPVISDDDPDEDICFEAVPVSIIEKYREGP